MIFLESNRALNVMELKRALNVVLAKVKKFDCRSLDILGK
jgi:hypothetical protein